ncbi:XC chemokine receptor 1 [Sarotherodon galilaeus]
MAQVVFALLALFLVSLCTGQDFCPKEKCPQYKVVETHQDFEVRLYGATNWITTKLDSTGARDYLAANSRLKNYVKRQAEAVCTGQDFCVGKCPHYKVLEAYPDFEVRLYDASTWITTKVDSSQASDVLAANSQLKDYAKKQTEAGFEIPTDSWPALIKVKDGKGDPEFSLSWFVPPATKTPEDSDPLVQLESKPEATVYVRVFGGAPSIQSGQENATKLREALITAGKNFDHDIYNGAAYESYFSSTHHNEIWIYAA